MAREVLGGGLANGSPSGVSIAPRDWQRIFDLANHYSAADEHDRALVFALLAAEQARRQHSLDIAERQYQIASQTPAAPTRRPVIGSRGDGAKSAWGRAQTQHFHGVAMYAASRFGECIEICREAIRLFNRTGDFWELNMARYQLAASLYGLADLAAASQEAWKMHASGLELGDIQASGLSICLVAKATCGRVPQEIVQAELDRPRGADCQTTSQVWQAEGLRRLATGDFLAAAEAFQRSWDIARRGGRRTLKP